MLRVIARSGVNNPKWSFVCGISPCSANQHDYKKFFQAYRKPLHSKELVIKMSVKLNKGC